MRRFNSTSINREDLSFALTNVQIVRRAVLADSCLICSSKGVNACALCEGCSSNLTPQEWELSLPWLEGRIT